MVSARKYRPRKFEEVVGQEHITTTLKNAIESNHLAQALLFCGPRGVGKTTCARIVARMINDLETDDLSLNIFELDAASNNSVDHIRNLTDQVRYPPQAGNYKVYIIDEVHMLSNQAFNAFLKTLEEPPPYAIFILATTEKHKVIPTILSRCQIYDFNRISVMEIREHLKEIAKKEGIKAEEQALHLIAQKADGALRDALSIFDLITTFSSDNSITYQSTIDNLHILDYDYYFRVTDLLNNEDASSALILFDEILRLGFDGHDFIMGLGQHLRNLLICKDPATLELLEESENVKKKYEEQSGEISQSFLMTAINIASQCDLQYKESRNQRLHVELAIMKMAHIRSALKFADQSAPAGTVKTTQGELKKKSGLKSQKGNDELPEEKTTGKVEEEPTEFDPGKKQETEALTEDKKDTQNSDKIIEDTGDLKESSTASSKKIHSGSLKKTTRIPSVSVTEEKEDEKENPGEDIIELENQVSESRNDVFSPDDLNEAWRAFASIRRKQGKAQEQHIFAQPYTLSDDNLTVTIELNNSLQMDILEEIKNDFVQFLRNKLQNDSIMLEINLRKDHGKKKLYTDKEKLEHMAEKNPVVNDLQKKLGLDPDF